VIDGYALETVTSLASALTPLIVAYDFHIRETSGRLVAADNLSVAAAEFGDEHIVEGRRRETIPLLDKRPSGVSLSYISGDFAYQPAVATKRYPRADQYFVARTALPLVLTEGQAAKLAAAQFQVLSSAITTQVSFPVGPSAGLEIADAIRFNARDWRVERLVDEGIVRHVELRAIAPHTGADRAISIPGIGDSGIYPARPAFEIVDVSGLAPAGSIGPMIAVSAAPWVSSVAVHVGATAQTLRQKAIVSLPAGIGQTLSEFDAGEPEQWDNDAEIIVSLPGEALSSADEAAILDGANRLLIEHPNGWELLAWRSAELVETDQWRLTGLLRGLNDTVAAAGGAGLTVILADDRLVQVPLDADQVGVALLWRVGTAATISFTFQPPTASA